MLLILIVSAIYLNVRQKSDVSSMAMGNPGHCGHVRQLRCSLGDVG